MSVCPTITGAISIPCGRAALDFFSACSYDPKGPVIALQCPKYTYIEVRTAMTHVYTSQVNLYLAWCFKCDVVLTCCDFSCLATALASRGIHTSLDNEEGMDDSG